MLFLLLVVTSILIKLHQMDVYKLIKNKSTNYLSGIDIKQKRGWAGGMSQGTDFLDILCNVAVWLKCKNLYSQFSQNMNYFLTHSQQ